MADTRPTYPRVEDAVGVLFKVLKEQLKERTLSKGNRHYISVPIRTHQWGHGVRPFGSQPGPGSYIDYEMYVGNNDKHSVKAQDLYTLSKVSQKLTELIRSEMKKATIQSESMSEGVSLYSSSYDIINRVTIYDKPQKEFEALRKWLKKYSDVDIDSTAAFSVQVVGKRGCNYGESGGRNFLAYNSNRCQDILRILRLRRGSKDTITLKKYEEIYDPEKEYGIRCETETYGTKYVGYTLTIKTPTGKVKYEVNIF